MKPPSIRAICNMVHFDFPDITPHPDNYVFASVYSMFFFFLSKTLKISEAIKTLLQSLSITL